MPFAIAMVWRERKDHIRDSYFYMINLKRINRRNKHHVQYTHVPSAIRPIPHSPDLPVPEPEGNMKYRSDSKHSDMSVVARDEAYNLEEDDQPVPYISRIQRPDKRPEPFKGVCSAAGFTSQKETSVGTRNNVLLVSRP